MSTVNGVGSNSYYYVPANYVQSNLKDQTDNTATTKNTDAGSSESDSNEAKTTNNSLNSSSNDISSSVLASLLAIKENSVSTLLDALNKNSGSSKSTDNSLYNLLELSSKLTMLQNGINPDAVTSANDQSTGSSGDSSSSTETENSLATLLNALSNDQGSSNSSDDSITSLLKLSTEYNMLQNGINPYITNSTTAKTGDQSTGSSSDSTSDNK
jgi:epidermal growth factor receptor substrate 15